MILFYLILAQIRASPNSLMKGGDAPKTSPREDKMQLANYATEYLWGIYGA